MKKSLKMKKMKKTENSLKMKKTLKMKKMKKT